MLCCCGGAVSNAITLPVRKGAEQLPSFCRETKSEQMMMSVSSVYGTQIMKCHSCREASCRGAHLNQMALVPKLKEAGKREKK